MVASLAILNRQSACQIVLIDGKGRGLMPFAGLGHLVRPPITNVAEAAEVLEWLVAEMERRDRQCVEWPHIVTVIDELADLLMQGGAAIEHTLARLVQRARVGPACDCSHAEAGGQRDRLAHAQQLPAAHRGTRLFGPGFASGGRRWGSRGRTLDGQRRHAGDSGGQTQRFQGATISESDIRELAAGRGRWPRISIQEVGDTQR